VVRCLWTCLANLTVQRCSSSSLRFVPDHAKIDCKHCMARLCIFFFRGFTAFAPVTDMSPPAGLEAVTYMHECIAFEQLIRKRSTDSIRLIFETRLRFPRRLDGLSIIMYVRRDPSAPRTFLSPLDCDRWGRNINGLLVQRLYIA
jgi:hypothetical protein